MSLGRLNRVPGGDGGESNYTEDGN